MKVYLKSDVECTVDGVGLLEPGKEVEVDVPTFQLYHGVTASQANFPRTITVIYDTDRDDAGSAVEATDNTEPPATNLGSGNDEEAHQDAKEDA
jgi:hypothetical protein